MPTQPSTSVPRAYCHNHDALHMILTRVFQTDAELSRLIGTLVINAKVRAPSMTCDVKEERDDVLKDSENTSKDLSMAAFQTDDLPRGGIPSERPECQFHTNVCTQNCPRPSPISLIPSLYLNRPHLTRTSNPSDAPSSAPSTIISKLTLPPAALT